MLMCQKQQNANCGVLFVVTSIIALQMTLFLSQLTPQLLIFNPQIQPGQFHTQTTLHFNCGPTQDLTRLELLFGHQWMVRL